MRRSLPLPALNPSQFSSSTLATSFKTQLEDFCDRLWNDHSAKFGTAPKIQADVADSNQSHSRRRTSAVLIGVNVRRGHSVGYYSSRSRMLVTLLIPPRMT